MGLTNTPSDLLPGTLELLILKSLVSGPKHGYAIVEHLRLASDDILNIGESALYPALQRLLFNAWVKAEWGTSENNRRARFYTSTAPRSIGWWERSSACWRRREVPTRSEK